MNSPEQPRAEADVGPVGVVAMDVSNIHLMLDDKYLGPKPDTKTVLLFKDLEIGTPLYPASALAALQAEVIRSNSLADMRKECAESLQQSLREALENETRNLQTLEANRTTINNLFAEVEKLRRHLDNCIGAIDEEVRDSDGEDHPVIQHHKRIADAARAALQGGKT